MLAIALAIGFFLGCTATVALLVTIGTRSGRTGANSRVRVKEDTVAVLTKGAH